jgi:hypothetical protein
MHDADIASTKPHHNVPSIFSFFIILHDNEKIKVNREIPPWSIFPELARFQLMWRQQDLQGKILVRKEQGIGSEIMASLHARKFRKKSHRMNIGCVIGCNWNGDEIPTGWAVNCGNQPQWFTGRLHISKLVIRV